MNVKEIVSRKTGSEITTEEMIFVVEKYIKEKKNVDVNIDILKDTFNMSPLILRQLNKLNKAFDYASRYFLSKEDDK